MRKFSESEKDTIRDLVNNNQCNLYHSYFNVFYDVFIEKEYFFDATQKKFYYNINKVKGDDLNQEKRIIVDRIMLINYLVDNRYLYTMPLESRQYVHDYGTKTEYHIKLDLPIFFEERFYEFATKDLIVSQELLTLVDNDFKEYDELVLDEAQKQSKSARISIVLSIVALVLSVVSVIISAIFR